MQAAVSGGTVVCSAGIPALTHDSRAACLTVLSSRSALAAAASLQSLVYFRLSTAVIPLLVSFVTA
jgi:hypothetical protein